jgi:glycosyltransferase involved in cell wall biosynthesis
MPRLKVMIWHWGRRGGGPRYTLELARVLADRQDMDIFLSLSRQSEMYLDFNNIPVVGRYDVDTYESIGQFFVRSLQLPLLRNRFRRYLCQNSIDVVFCTMDHLWNIAMTATIHDAGSLYLLAVHDATRHPGEDQRWRRWLLSRDIAASDGALVLTKAVRTSLVNIYHYPPERTYLSTLGHFGDGAPKLVREMPRDRPFRLLFFGRILSYKGIDLLLEALALLRRYFPNLSLEIWGGGDISPYRSQIEVLGNIRVENRWIDESEIAGIFARTDLAVLPYREASQSAVVAIAFAVGMPCVATPILGLCEQITDGMTGVIAEGMRAEDFAKAISRVVRAPDLYRHLSNGCLEATRTSLSWDVIGNSVADAFWGVHRQGRRAQ